ncbi:MAG: cystathionine beta-lyase [Alphaproteobacteria bacterium]
MKKESLLATLGCCDERYEGVVNLPPHRASTILFNGLDEFEKADSGQHPRASYGRYGTPSTRSLEHALAQIGDADHAIVTSSGLSAIVTSLMAFLQAGDHLLMVDSTYAPSRRFCKNVLSRFGVEVTYYDPLIGSDIAKLMKDNTRVVFVESPGSLTFEVQDIPAIAKVAHSKGAMVIGDMTWGTLLYQKPFDLGVDVIVHSATKYIAGHSDLVMGLILFNDAHHENLVKTYRNMGACPAADNCYLAMRGLRTMALRIKHQYESTMKVAQWMKARPEIEEVLYPALPGSPGHELWKRDFSGACSLFAVAFKPIPHEAMRAFIDSLQLFGLGYSWGGFESLMTTFKTDNIRSASKWPYEGPGLRIHIGLEHTDDIIADLEHGFKQMKKQKAA